MNECASHWAALRAEVERRGLMHLVSRSGKDAADRLVGSLEGHKTFDPLMGASLAIFAQFTQNVGLAALMPGPDGAMPCPLCDVDKRGPAKASNWIEGSVEDQYQYALELGLLSRA